MEASENTPEPDRDRPTPDGVVRAIENRLVIERLTISDERAAALVRDRQEAGQEPARTVADAIEIGARVLDREDTAAEVDYVRAELERAQSGFERRGAELGERLSAELEQGSEALTVQIAEAFGAERNDSVQAQIRAIVSEASEAQKLELTKLLSSEDGSNPLSGVQARLGKAILESEERHRAEMGRLRDGHTNESRAMQAQISELKENIARLLDKQEADQALAEAEEAGTRKGRGFEELVHEQVHTLASGHDDVAHHVGDVASESGGKKGDTVLELCAASGAAEGTIVFEAKNRQLSKNDAWAELNAVIAERDADFGVLVVAGEDKVPRGLEELTEYQGNKMIVVLDREDPDPLALRLIYRYARAKVLATRSGALQVDASGVRAAAEDAQARLKTVNKIRKSLTSITNSADRARGDVDEMVAGVEGCLERVELLVSEAADAEPGGAD